MANEFKIKHGFISTGDGSITGGLTVTGAAYADNNSRVATRPWVTQFLSDNSYATATDISTAISNLVDSAPGTLDTLNELAAAIGDDADFAGTITTSISTKLPLAGGTMTGNITFTDDAEGIVWSRNTDGASIKFYNTADGDTDSRLEFHTNDNNNEYFRWTHGPSGGALYEVMKLMPTSSGSSRLTVAGDIYAASNKVATEAHVSSNYLSKFHDITLTLTGDVSGSGTFNNMGDLSFDVQVANDSHNHDGRYYTETEMDTFLGGKLSTSGGTLSGGLTINEGNLRIVQDVNNIAQVTLGEDPNSDHVILEYDGTGSGATNYFYLYSGLDGWAAKGTSLNMQPSTGNIAIGTTTFTEKFNVDGNVRFTGTISANGYNKSNWDTAYDTTQSLGSAAFESANTFAAASHTHAAGDITSGTLAAARLSGTYNISVSGSSASSSRLNTDDNRTISPSEDSNGSMSFGFTSFQNDNSAPYADYLHLRSYTDSSGGRDNLLMFSKSDLEIRLWQQDYGVSDNYSEFRDVAFKDELQTPAIISNGSTPSLSSGISAAEVRTLIGAGTSSSDTNFYLNGATFNTSNGVLTLNVAGATDQTVDLDGRYSQTGHNHDGRYMILAGDGGTYADLVDDIDGTSVFSFANYVGAPHPNVSIVTTYASHYSGRRAQFWHGDTPAGGVWWRGRQGDAAGYHPWQKLWTSYDFNPDTFLTTTGKAADSNLLDGINSTSFLRSDVGDTATGTMTFSNVVNLNGAVNFNGVNGQNFTVNTDASRIIWDFQRNGTRRMSFYHETNEDTFNFSFQSGNKLQINGNRILTTADSSSFDASGAADDVNSRIDNEVLPSIPTNNNELTNGAGYITDGNTGWNNSYGFITASDSITGNAATATTAGKVSTSVGAGSNVDLLYAQIASNDYFRLRVGGASNAGSVEIATADDGTEPIYVRQYTGAFSTLQRTATLLDGSGNTSFPGTVTASTFSGSLSGNATTASTLSASRNIALTGDVTGSANFNGGSNIAITATVANDSHTHDGRYYTESESDARFVNVTGDNLTGDLSVSGASLSVTSTADGSEAFFVDGVNGRLFTITDSLSDSLFSVNTISGLPVIEAFSDNTVKLGPFSNPVTIDAAGVLAIGGVTAATQTYVDTAVNNIIGGAPGALDTLNELAAAINDDASFASSVTSSLSLKAPLASPALTGTPTAPTQATSNNSTRIATTAFVKAQGYVTTDTNYYLNGISRSGNVLTFSVNGATNQTYTFGSAAWAATTAFDAAGTAATEAGTVNTRIDEEVLPLIQTPAITSNGATPALNTGISAAEVRSLIGAQASGSYLATTGKAADSNLLDGIDSTSFLRSDTSDSFSGQLTNASINETPSYDRGAINLQPSVSGGSTGITFRSRVNSTSDAGYIWWYDDNDHYNELNSTENGVLLIAAQNDGGATSEDAIAIESSGDIYLNAGVASGAIGSGIFNTARGNVYLGYAADRARVLTTDDSSSFDAAGAAGAVNTRIDEEVLPAIGAVTLASLGYTGATNANYITNNNELTNGAGYLTTLGFSYSTGVTANHVVQRNANGYIYANHINFSTTETENPSINSFFVSNGDGWSRKASVAHVKSQLGLGSAAYVATSTFDAAGSADAVNLRIDEEVLPAIPTNNNQLTNGAGYLTIGQLVPSQSVWSNATRFTSEGDIGFSGAGNHSLQVFSEQGNDAFMAFHISSDHAVYFGLENGTNRLYTGGWSLGSAKHQIWDTRDFTSTNVSNWNTAYGWGNHASAGYAQGSFLPLAGGTVTGTIAANGGINMNNTNITNVNHITINDAGYGEGVQWSNWMIYDSPDNLSNASGNFQISSVSDNSVRVTVDTNGNLYPSRDRQHTLGLETNRWQIVFCEILDSAGQHEKNLQNPEGEKSIGDYATGTVLVWKGGKNIPCTEYADHMRMGIAVKDVASPLIQGAEPVLVTGKVNEGDYLITSRKEGHAEAISPELMRQQGLYDCVLGKALENGEGESYLVKTWVNI